MRQMGYSGRRPVCLFWLRRAIFPPRKEICSDFATVILAHDWQVLLLTINFVFLLCTYKSFSSLALETWQISKTSHDKKKNLIRNAKSSYLNIILEMKCSFQYRCFHDVVLQSYKLDILFVITTMILIFKKKLIAIGCSSLTNKWEA